MDIKYIDSKYSDGEVVAFSPRDSIAALPAPVGITALPAPVKIADSSATHSRGFSWNFGRRTRLYPRLLEDLNEAERLHVKGKIGELQIKLEKIDQTIGKIFPKSVFWSHLKEIRQFLFSRKYQSAFETASTIVEKFKHIACYRAVRYLHTKHMNPYGMGTRTDSDVTVTTPHLIPLAIEESTDRFRKKIEDWFSQNAGVVLIGGAALSVGFFFSYRKMLLLTAGATTGALALIAHTAHTLYQMLGDEPRQDELNCSDHSSFHLGNGSSSDELSRSAHSSFHLGNGSSSDELSRSAHSLRQRKTRLVQDNVK